VGLTTERDRASRPMCDVVAVMHDSGMQQLSATRPGNWALDPRARVALLLTSGLAVGVLTSFGQGHLSEILSALVNSASAWLVAPFLVGSRLTSRRGATAAGLAVCLLQLVGYYAATELRGFTPGGSIVIFWLVCAAFGGPAFGEAGRLWKQRTNRWSGLGSAVLPAAFLSEGLWVYLHELHYYTTAAVWIAIGAILALTMTRMTHGRRWLGPAVATGLLAEMLLTQVYSRSF
jgi:hypothetical protein